MNDIEIANEIANENNCLMIDREYDSNYQNVLKSRKLLNFMPSAKESNIENVNPNIVNNPYINRV